MAVMGAAATLPAEDGAAAWLRYAAIPAAGESRNLPSLIVEQDSSASGHAAAAELKRGLSSMLGRQFLIAPPGFRPEDSDRDLLLVGSNNPGSKRSQIDSEDPLMAGEAYRIHFVKRGRYRDLVLQGGTPQAELYAAFGLLEQVAAEKRIPEDQLQRPSAPIRWVDEWDNLDGSVERGYAGRSIFFDRGHVRSDLGRAGEYARLLASIGINGCNVNNVNADRDLMTSEHLKEFARIADVFRPWGVKLALSVDLSSPETVGHLATFDPLDPAVIAWWQSKVNEIYNLIPDFAGFTVKADSEGRAGPSQYGRSPADAANVLARALRHHGGVVLYRAFVYNHHLDWRDRKADRARAAYDNFAKYDGSFEPNVIVQIKHGPIDFQAREPVSPLFAAMRHTGQAVEFQTTQEYTGQQRHMVFLPAMWKWTLDTDLRVDDKPSALKSIVTGHRFSQPYGGFVSVANVGLETNWLHHPMAMANLYGFGKLAWNPDESLNEILDLWTRMTWGNDPQVDSAIVSMLRGSWATYESYTGPNGMGTLTNILGVHFGPGIESAERNGWGQWFRGEPDGIGMDRTVATGTGYIGQYPPELAAVYESEATCPDDLLLFFHHVPYNYRLHSGKTLVQSVYDAHYEGARTAVEYVPKWEALEHKLDSERYARVHELLVYQAGHAIVWRDAINEWFQRISGIADDGGRVGHDPNRIEAEDMISEGYTTVKITPQETGSNGEAVICLEADGCRLEPPFGNLPAFTTLLYSISTFGRESRTIAFV